MHPEADAFLDAIFDHPDDDTHRLVYADWLEEHGQGNYAQFIRLQCAAAREKLWSNEANRLWEEIGRVWTKLDDEWWPATRDEWTFERQSNFLDAIDFDRGFLRPEVPIDTHQIERYSACWAWLPGGDVSLADIRDLERLAGMPAAQRLRKVSLAPHCTYDLHHKSELNACLTLFARSEFTRKVRVLDISAVHLRKQMVQSLMRDKSLPGLEELRVAFGRRSDCDDPAETMKQLQQKYKRVVWD